MTRTRQQIREEIEHAKDQIQVLRERICELNKENALLCDDEQWFIEKEEEEVVERRPKTTVKALVGRVHYIQNFKDQDTGELVPVELNRIVRINGEWQ